MENLRTTIGSAHRLRAGAMLVALLLGVVLGIAGPAAAGNVLFIMNSSSCTINDLPPGCGGRPLPQVGGTVSGPTLMTTPNGSGADFTIPSKLFSVTGSFTASYGPYPYFRGTYTRYNLGGSMMAGNWTPSATLTFIDPDTQYPYVTATPAPGKLIAKVGPNGMAGPNRFIASTYYVFTYLTPGVNLNIASFVSDRGGPSSQNRVYAGFSVGVQQTNMTTNGVLFFLEPNIWAMTGTLTGSQPDAAVPQYFVVTAMDNRTPAGASGTIQVVSGALIHNYTVAPLPPPNDGTGTPTAYRNALLRTQRTTFQFTPAPEPGQIALIGMGVVGLAGIARTMRRSSRKGI